MEVVYLETSFVSLLVGNPSRDLITAANQQVTRDWWRLRRDQFVCVASSEVVREASDGDAQEAVKRQGVLSQLPILPFSSEADQIMRALLATRVLPPKAQTDAAHLAIAAAAGGRLSAHLELSSSGERADTDALGSRGPAFGLEIAESLHTGGTDGRFIL
jgi:hypothetical protein